jgi:hypothetical protein
LAILSGSFRLLARTVLPLASLFILAACGGSKPQQQAAATVGVHGPGFAFEAPQGWRIGSSQDATVVRRGHALVSVTRIPLVKAYDPAKFAAVSKELDALAMRLAHDAGQQTAKGETTTVAGRRVRSYRYGTVRIGFVLEGKREYQLYCAPANAACDLLFSTFTLTGPQAS